MELISISEAADRLGAKPWDVERLLAAGHLQEVVYVDGNSLREYQEQQ